MLPPPSASPCGAPICAKQHCTALIRRSLTLVVATEVPAGKVGRPTTQPSLSFTLMRLALPSLCGIVGSRL